MCKNTESKKYVRMSDDELKTNKHYTSLGALCEYKIKCWKCKKWDYALMDLGCSKIYTCYECKQEYRRKKEIERMKANGTYKEPTPEEIDEEW
tara:strand:+ start:3129 stop:3407 length:279 start_codon:yes stop_codon:yes gene_type:complete